MGAMRIRPATLSDATHLAALVDIAGEGFASYFWSQMADPGQSPFEIGRARAMRDEGIIDRVREETAPYFYDQWARLGDHPLVGEARSIGLMAAWLSIRRVGNPRWV